MKEYKYKINGNTYKVCVGDIENNVAKVEVNGVPYNVQIDSQTAAPVNVVKAHRPSAAPRTETGERVITKSAPTPAGAYAVKAPLPGTVLSINVKVGDTVKASDTVIILEAMKMENSIHAGRDGRVASISASQGAAVQEGEVLITLE